MKYIDISRAGFIAGFRKSRYEGTKVPSSSLLLEKASITEPIMPSHQYLKTYFPLGTLFLLILNFSNSGLARTSIGTAL